MPRDLDSFQLHGWLEQRSGSDRLALRRGAESWSYRRLHERASSLAAHLTALNPAVAGGRIAALARDGLVFASAAHAAVMAGAALVPLNTRLAAAELAWIVSEAEPDLLLCDAAHAGLAREVLRRLDRGLGAAPALAEFAGADWETAEYPGRKTRIQLSDVQSVVYTSGTTGRPKGALITFANQFFSAAASAFRLGLDPEDRWLVPLPLFHVGGQAVLFRSVLYGTAAILQDAFDPVEANRAVDEGGVTLVSVVANMLARMLDARDGQGFPPRFRAALLGGGPAPEPLLRRCVRLGVPVLQSYGLTETNSQAATLSLSEAAERVGSAGLPLTGTEIRVLSLEDGRPLPPRAEGEIAVRGPTVAGGYFRNEEATRAVFRDGWLRTGDIGYLDESGYLYVLDRRSDLIVSGGENVYPAEVEAALLEHEAVAEAGVVGIPDERYGRVPVAAVRRRPGSQTGEADLLAHCRQRLAGYKVPKSIRFVDEMPRNAAGKLLRRELSRWFAEQRMD